MFFGRGSGTENVKLVELPGLLDTLFEKKLGRFRANSEDILRGLKDIKRDFAEACIKFDRVQAEPFVENTYAPNINFIKAQKKVYLKALLQVVDEIRTDPESNLGVYKRYVEMSSYIEGSINQIKMTNAKFKQVVYCYPNYLGEFKRLESSFERIRDQLKLELDKKRIEFDEYTAIMSKISSLNSKIEELKALKNSINLLGTATKEDSRQVGKDYTTLLRLLNEKKSEFSNLNTQIYKLSARISSLMLPLERASKKFDHLSVRKKTLHDFITNIEGRINTETEYVEFAEMIKELKGFLESGKIEAKNSDELYGIILVLLGPGIYNAIMDIKAAKKEMVRVESEIKGIETTLKEIENGVEISKRVTSRVEEMKNDVERISVELNSEKSNIEKLFLEHYGKRISITL